MNPVLRAGLAAGGVLAVRTCVRHVPAVRRALERRNFRDEPVTLAEGPAVVGGLVAALADRPVDASVVLAAGGLGLLDDVVGTGANRGLAGHLDALRHGEVTTGAIKIIGLAGVGAGAGLVLDAGVRPSTAAAAVLVAGGANLVNLFDLRPGRALKVCAPVVLALAPHDLPVAAAVCGAGGAAWPDDLAGRSMMGDTGANALGALLGLAAARRLRPTGRVVAAGAVVALTLASEKVSFSQVIAGHPVLRRIDEAGRAR